MMDRMGPMMGYGAVALVWLLFAALLVVGIVFAVRGLSDLGGSASATSSALQILEERFARGEIDRDEFEERRRALRS
jgi:putative membrane protein